MDLIKLSYLKLSYIVVLCLFSPIVFAQADRQTIVQGTIRNAKGEAIEYASVYIKNRQGGTQSEKNGSFSLHARPGKQTLCVKILGYDFYEKEIEVTAGHQITVDVRLKEKRHNLQEVVVESKSAVQRIKESAFNVVAIDTKALYNTSMGISNALDKVSGVKIRESGGLGSSNQISLNGFTGRHVKVFMDGIPMEGSGSSFQINNIPVGIADRIEVYKGVVPVEFGSDALGGAINIVTNQASNSYLDASYSYGSFNTHKTNISLGHTAKNGFTFSLNAYQNYSDNDYKIKAQLLDLTTGNYSKEEYWFKRFHDNYHNEAVIAKVGVVNKPWATRLLVGVTLSQEKADIQNANLMKIVYGGKKRKAKSINPSLTYMKKDLFTPNLNFSLDAHYNKVRNNNIDTLARQYNWNGEWRTKSSKGEGQYSLSEFDNKNGYVRANLTYHIGEKHFFILNDLFSRFERKTTDALANSENSTATTFMKRKNDKNVLGFSYKFVPTDKWNVLGFVKYYNTTVTGPVETSTGTSNQTYEEREKSSDVTGYGLAATYFLNDAIQFKASYEKSYRLATETELFGDEVLETGNAGLKPENSQNINVNVSYDQTFNDLHSVYFDVGFVYRDTRDYIRRQIEQRFGGAYYTNHGKVRNIGFDVEARYFYKNALAVGGNLTYQNMRNREKYSASGQELIYYDDRMPNVPYLFGNFDASYTFNSLFDTGDRLSVGYNLRYIHDFFRDWESEGGDITIPEQLSHDLNVTYSLKNGRYNLAFEVKNLTDKMMFDNYSLQKPGRSFTVKLRYFLFKSTN